MAHLRKAQLRTAWRFVDSCYVGNSRNCPGPGRAWRLVGGRSSFWMEAHRHWKPGSKPEEVAGLTRMRLFVALKMRSGVSPYSGHEVSIKGWPQARTALQSALRTKVPSPE